MATKYEAIVLYKTRLWRETLKNHPQGLLVNTVAIIGMATLVGATAAPWFWQWAALSLALTALRYFFYLHCRRHVERHPGAPVPPYQIALHCVAAVATAVLWSALAWLGIPAFVDKDKFSVIIINSALSAGATATLASMRLTGKFYIAILVIPACISLLTMGNGNFQMIAVMGFVFAWVMLGSHENNYKLLLTRDKEDLILEMAEKNAAISKSNAELEKIVAVRTEELQFLANRDPLTSLLNRRGFLQHRYPPATSLRWPTPTSTIRWRCCSSPSSTPAPRRRSPTRPCSGGTIRTSGRFRRRNSFPWPRPATASS